MAQWHLRFLRLGTNLRLAKKKREKHPFNSNKLWFSALMIFRTVKYHCATAATSLRGHLQFFIFVILFENSPSWHRSPAHGFRKQPEHLNHKNPLNNLKIENCCEVMWSRNYVQPYEHEQKFILTCNFRSNLPACIFRSNFVIFTKNTL